MPRKPVSNSYSHQEESLKTLHIAVQGCCHGELNKIYEECRSHEDNWGKKIDLLLCCGDFQSIRNEADLDSMAVPAKYRAMGDFHEYIGPAGSAKLAPYLTIFVGGNHEASNVLYQNYYGGYIAPNIYYLGHSGVIDVKGVRIAGLSGIWKHQDSHAPYPKPPYNDSTVRSAYHVRKYEVDKLSLFGTFCAKSPDTDRRPIDIMLTHDWPAGITKYGDEEQLLRYKPYFGPDIERGELGNPLTMSLLSQLQPRYWCSAHLHCSFHANVAHTDSCRTQFLALDKCTKGKSFLDFIDVKVPSGACSEALTIPPLWQEVLRVAQPALSRSVSSAELHLGDVSNVNISATLPTAISVNSNTNLGVEIFSLINQIEKLGNKRSRDDEDGQQATVTENVEDWLIED